MKLRNKNASDNSHKDLRICRKKNTVDIDNFYRRQYNREVERVIVMLKKFSVENFKGFKEKITFDIGSPNNYNFN